MIKYIITLTILFLLLGCAGIKGGPDDISNTQEDIEKLHPLFSTDAIINYYNKDSKYITIRKSMRNKIIETRMLAIDISFSKYLDDLQKQLRRDPFFLDIISIGLTGTAALITPGTTTAVLAGVDTALKGARQSYSNEVLIDKTLPILISQMTSERNRIRASINNNLKQSDSDYPLALGLSQLDAYYRAGTVLGAIENVRDITASDARESNKVLFDSTEYQKNEYSNKIKNIISNENDTILKNKYNDFIINYSSTFGIQKTDIINSNKKDHIEHQKAVLIELLKIKATHER